MNRYTFAQTARPVCWLIALVVAVQGCAGPVLMPIAPPPHYLGVLPAQGDVPGNLPGVPQVVAHDAPLRSVGPGPEERARFERQREAFNAAQKEKEAGGGQSGGASPDYRTEDWVQCVVKTLVVFSPLCLILVPIADSVVRPLIAAPRNAVVAYKPYMPDLPPDSEVEFMGKLINEEMTAPRVAVGVENEFRTHYGPAHSEYPRLSISAGTATLEFLPAAPFTLVATISFVVQAEPVFGVTWPPTEHRYVARAIRDRSDLAWAVGQAETRLADSILATYRLSRWMRLQHVGSLASAGPLPAGRLYIATPYRREDRSRNWLLVRLDAPSTDGERSHVVAVTNVNCTTGTLSLDHHLTYADEDGQGQLIGSRLYEPPLAIEDPASALTSATRAICSERN